MSTSELRPSKWNQEGMGSKVDPESREVCIQVNKAKFFDNPADSPKSTGPCWLIYLILSTRRRWNREGNTDSRHGMRSSESSWICRFRCTNAAGYYSSPSLATFFSQSGRSFLLLSFLLLFHFILILPSESDSNQVNCFTKLLCRPIYATFLLVNYGWSTTRPLCCSFHTSVPQAGHPKCRISVHTYASSSNSDSGPLLEFCISSCYYVKCYIHLHNDTVPYRI